MDTHEIIYLEDPRDKEKFQMPKILEESPKHEKNPCQEFPYFQFNKISECLKSPENPKEKLRIRQFDQSRTEMHLEPKVMMKRFHEYKEVDRGTYSKVPFLPMLSIRTNAIEEVYKELKECKQNITEIEERNKVNAQCIEIGKVKIRDLEERHQALRRKAGFGCSHEERKEELGNKLKAYQKTWKISVQRLRSKIQELEEEAKDLFLKADTLKNHIFRKGQQQKLLKKGLNDSGSNSESGYHSCDLLNSSANLKTVIHTPSWNSLSKM